MSLPQFSEEHQGGRSVSGHHPQAHPHGVQFYETESYLCDAVYRFLAPAILNGNPIIVIATPQHHKAFRDCLEAHGFDTRAASENRRFVEIDAHETLETFMDGELPDRDRFLQTVGG